MNYYITYFYNIRFLSQNTIPISTAKWDPKWFHNFKGQDEVFKDARGIYNGVRLPELSPYKIENVECSKVCMKNPSTCSFIKSYRDYLHTLEFSKVMSKIDELAKVFQAQSKLEELPDICLLVHEKPDNPCSERQPLIDWFRENGIELKEFRAK